MDKSQPTAPNAPDDSTPLPVIRPDLIIQLGPMSADGAPTFVVYNPSARTYDRYSWAGMQLLERLVRPISLGEIKESLARTTVLLSDEEILAFCNALIARGHTMQNLVRPPDQLLEEYNKKQSSFFKWLMHHYLYFRVPLLQPDDFLEQALPFAAKFVSRLALFIYFFAAIAGLVLAIPRAEQFFSTIQYFFNLKGIMIYGSAIIVIKAIHEFSHAFTAKSIGARVPVMGVAFMVLWPVAYCETTDAWRNPNRYQRFKVAFAGIYAEMVMAGLSLLGWVITQPGLLNSVFYVTCTASLASTLLVNLNPAMSFDGYYMLMDISGVDNLRSRAFASTKHFIRTRLFGLDLEIPENGLSPSRRTWFGLYSIYAWIYRFFLYLGIAFLVYYKFTKILGIFLFSFEIFVFILNPIVQEARFVFAMRKKMKFKLTSVCFLALIAGLLLWAAMPFPRAMLLPAAVEARDQQLVYAPESGVVSSSSAHKGMRVSKGQILVTLNSFPLETSLKLTALDAKMARIQLAILQSSGEAAELPVQQEAVLVAEARLHHLEKQNSQLTIRSEMTGVLSDWPDSLSVGDSVSKGSPLGIIVSNSGKQILAYVEDKFLDSLASDMSAVFYTDDKTSVPVRLQRIQKTPLTILRHASLSSQLGGEVPVSADGKILETIYLAEFLSEESMASIPSGTTGIIRMKSAPRSYLYEGLKHAARFLVGESSF